MGRQRCWRHSRTQAGSAEFQRLYGVYTDAVPPRIAEAMKRISADENLLSLIQELTLLKARLDDVLSRTESGESGAAWRALKAAVRAYDKALRAGDEPAQHEAIHMIKTTVQEGAADWEVWDDVRAVVRDIARLAESERRYRLEQQHMITVDAAYVLLSQLVDAVRTVEKDQRVLDLVNTEFTRIVNRTNPNTAQSAPIDFTA